MNKHHANARSFRWRLSFVKRTLMNRPRAGLIPKMNCAAFKLGCIMHILADIYLVMCFVFVFAALLEYAAVNYTYWGARAKRKAKRLKEQKRQKEEDGIDFQVYLLAFCFFSTARSETAIFLTFWCQFHDVIVFLGGSRWDRTGKNRMWRHSLQSCVESTQQKQRPVQNILTKRRYCGRRSAISASHCLLQLHVIARHITGSRTAASQPRDRRQLCSELPAKTPRDIKHQASRARTATEDSVGEGRQQDRQVLAPCLPPQLSFELFHSMTLPQSANTETAYNPL